MEEEKPVVTPKYLLSHGFELFTAEQSTEISQMPFDDNKGSLNFREKEFHRQMFVVLFVGYNGDPVDGWHKDVFVQEDAGCRFVNIPFPWWDLTIEYFESVYYGIRGHKPKTTTYNAEDAEFEIIQPKQITQSK